MATSLRAQSLDAQDAVGRPAAVAAAVRLDAHGDPAADVPLDAALDRVNEGHLVVVRGALQALGVFDAMYAATIETVARVASAAVADAVRAEGVERLHRHLTARQLFDVLDATTARFTPETGALVSGFARDLLGHRGPIYVGGKFWVRFFVPQDVYHVNRALFATRPGHLEILGPHRDSWFTTPTNAVTLWMAMGRVRRGNSMVVYPGVWGRPVARTTPTLPAPQHFGAPAVAELEPGDALVFRGEHLHASEINVTDETRYVLTVRFTASAPRYGEGFLWRPYTDLRLAGSALAPLATLRSRLSAAWLRQRVFRTRSAIRYHVPLAARLGV
jgi:hypothetical protein